MFLLYHSEGCNTSETVFHWCYVNDWHTTHAVVWWVTAPTDISVALHPRLTLVARPAATMVRAGSSGGEGSWRRGTSLEARVSTTRGVFFPTMILLDDSMHCRSDMIN
jgi:hypothetical protein